MRLFSYIALLVLFALCTYLLNINNYFHWGLGFLYLPLASDSWLKGENIPSTRSHWINKQWGQHLFFQFTSVKKFDVCILLWQKTVMSIPVHVDKLCKGRMSSVFDGNGSVPVEWCGWRSEACSRGLACIWQNFSGLFLIGIRASCLFSASDHCLGQRKFLCLVKILCRSLKVYVFLCD